MSDIFDEIIKDHEYHRALLQRVVETHGNSMERQNVFQELKLDITAHADAEEQTFYAALLSKPDVQDQARLACWGKGVEFSPGLCLNPLWKFTFQLRGPDVVEPA